MYRTVLLEEHWNSFRSSSRITYLFHVIVEDAYIYIYYYIIDTRGGVEVGTWYMVLHYAWQHGCRALPRLVRQTIF